MQIKFKFNSNLLDYVMYDERTKENNNPGYEKNWQKRGDIYFWGRLVTV